jgi:UDP-N-acetylmuramoylalanine-D-glutamate ligase
MTDHIKRHCASSLLEYISDKSRIAEHSKLPCSRNTTEERLKKVWPHILNA